MKRYGQVLALVLLLSGRMGTAQIPVPPGQGGTVTGVLRTPAGMPAANVRIAAMTRLDSLNTPGNASALVSIATTDESGRYRLENIPPGEYFIAAGRVDLPTYYPGTLESTVRKAISVAAGETISGLDFVFLDASRGGGQRTPFNVLGVLNQFGQNQGRGRTGGPTPPPTPSAPGTIPGGRRGGGPPRGNAPASPATATSAAWWTDTAFITRLGLTPEQKAKIEGIFEQHKQSLILSRAQLESGEAQLATMMGAETFDLVQARQTINRVVQARSELERAYALMTMDMRQALTRAQWTQLQNEIELDAPYQKKK